MPPSERQSAVDVVVPAHNGYELTAGCLRLLAAQTIAVNVILVDNGSSDGTPQRVAEEFPAVRVLALGRNRGFGAACNAGVAAGQGELVVLLNNDVEPPSDFVERLVRPLHGDPRLGSVAALLLRPGGALIDSVGLCADPTLAGFPRLQGEPVARAGEPCPRLLGPSGGAAAYRRVAWEEAGGMDERIFVYSEDLDLALRLRARGWRTTAAIDAAAVHLGSATAGRRSAWQREQAGFARGYLVRRYGVLHGPARVQALLGEAVVVAGDAVLARDLAAARGRLRGFRAARGLPRRPVPPGAVDPQIGLRRSLALRGVDYAAATGRRSTASRVA